MKIIAYIIFAIAAIILILGFIPPAAHADTVYEYRVTETEPVLDCSVAHWTHHVITEYSEKGTDQWFVSEDLWVYDAEIAEDECPGWGLNEDDDWVNFAEPETDDPEPTSDDPDDGLIEEDLDWEISEPMKQGMVHG